MWTQSSHVVIFNSLFCPLETIWTHFYFVLTYEILCWCFPVSTTSPVGSDCVSFCRRSEVGERKYEIALTQFSLPAKAVIPQFPQNTRGCSQLTMFHLTQLGSVLVVSIEACGFDETVFCGCKFWWMWPNTLSQPCHANHAIVVGLYDSYCNIKYSRGSFFVCVLSGSNFRGSYW